MSQNNGNGCKNLLAGRDEILEYLKISRNTFYKFVNMGLPVRVIDNRLYAHKTNIDDFFCKITRQSVKDLPNDVE